MYLMILYSGKPFFYKFPVFNIMLQHKCLRNKGGSCIVLGNEAFKHLRVAVVLNRAHIEMLSADKLPFPYKKHLNYSIISVTGHGNYILIIHGGTRYLLSLAYGLDASYLIPIPGGLLKFQLFRGFLHFLPQIFYFIFVISPKEINCLFHICMIIFLIYLSYTRRRTLAYMIKKTGTFPVFKGYFFIAVSDTKKLPGKIYGLPYRPGI